MQPLTSPYSLPLFPPPSQPFYPPPPPARRSSRGWIIAFLIVLFLLPITASGAYVAGYNNASVPAPASQAGVTVIVETPTPVEGAPTQPPAGIWTDIKKFTGTNNQQTEVFSVPAEWRIVWSEKATSGGAALFIVDLYTDTGQRVDTIADAVNESAHSTYDAHALPGSFYLKIQADTAGYTIDVQVSS